MIVITRVMTLYEKKPNKRFDSQWSGGSTFVSSEERQFAVALLPHSLALSHPDHLDSEMR
jgi:hypothetical protein